MLLMAVAVQAGCGGGAPDSDASASERPLVVVDTTFLADLVRQVSGEACTVTSIVPEEVDPHSFEPTPRDTATVAEANALMVTYRGLEPGLTQLFDAAARKGTLVVDVSADVPGVEQDPHAWLDPLAVVQYVHNIEESLVGMLPEAAASLRANAENYVARLYQLDAWISEQVAGIPPAKRLLVTNHESFGWFAARYGFTVVGTLLPGPSTGGAPSAERLANLISAIKESGVKAVFLESGSQEDLAEQVAREAGVKVVTDLYTHSLGEQAGSYVEMMEWNVKRIVEALE